MVVGGGGLAIDCGEGKKRCLSPDRRGMSLPTSSDICKVGRPSGDGGDMGSECSPTGSDVSC